MKVTEFRLLENDLTANRYGTSKQDENGETAALIKIVTPETGFTFDGGSLGIVAVEQKPGEIWLYVPRRAQRLTISHAAFGVLRNYAYTVPIESAKTYEMLLDIGTGCYANITAPVAKSVVYIDNERAGTVPIYNKYLNYGKHTIRAINGKFEGTMEVYVTTDRQRLNIDIDMKDMSHLYGDVRVSVDNNADIYFQGELVGTGLWDTQLKEGTYTVETSKENCEPQQTTFTVKPSQQNFVTAIAPIPHTGWLNLYTRPHNVIATDNGHPIELTEVQTLPVGTHQLSISRKGYVTKQQEYTIRHNETTRDTIQLERVRYVKPLAFYFGAGYTLRSLSGITGMLGAVIQGHDLQASYTFGQADSDPVNWYDTQFNLQSSITYRMNSFAFKYGYQFDLMRQLAITPQVGYSYDTLKGSLQKGTNLYADGATAHCVTLGVKLLLVPMQHVYIFAAPEFDVAVKKDPNFENMAQSNGSISAGGFVAHLGVLVSF